MNAYTTVNVWPEDGEVAFREVAGYPEICTLSFGRITFFASREQLFAMLTKAICAVDPHNVSNSNLEPAEAESEVTYTIT